MKGLRKQPERGCRDILTYQIGIQGVKQIMTNGLSDSKVKWLTYLVYILLSVYGAGMIYLQVQQGDIKVQQQTIKSDMASEYVRLERYQADQCRIEEARQRSIIVDDRILDKLDKIYEELRQK